MAHLPCYALSSSLEMMYDLNFTEGKKKKKDGHPLSYLLCLPLEPFW
jgi:hypothetical protein